MGEEGGTERGREGGGETREREKGLESVRGEECVCQVRCCVSLMTESQAKPQSMSINNPGWGRLLSDETRNIVPRLQGYQNASKRFGAEIHTIRGGGGRKKQYLEMF